MAVNIKLLLARHPFFLLFGEGGVECFDCGGILTAIGGIGCYVHPFFAVENAGDQLADEQCRRVVAGDDKADVLLFAAYKAAADVVAGVSENNINVVAHIPCDFKRVLDQ